MEQVLFSPTLSHSIYRGTGWLISWFYTLFRQHQTLEGSGFVGSPRSQLKAHHLIFRSLFGIRCPSGEPHLLGWRMFSWAG